MALGAGRVEVLDRDLEVRARRREPEQRHGLNRRLLCVLGQRVVYGEAGSLAAEAAGEDLREAMEHELLAVADTREAQEHETSRATLRARLRAPTGGDGPERTDPRSPPPQ